MRNGNRIDCAEFRKAAFHFQADELPRAQRDRLQGHLAGCAECARYLEVEDSFLNYIKTRVDRVPAPPGLETRIRACLAETTGARRAGLWGRLWSPGPAVVAAALVLAVALAAIWSGMPGGGGGDAGSMIHVVRAVTVVDQACDQGGRSLEEQIGCRDYRHVNALKTADGVYWNLSLSQATAREIVFDPQWRGRRVVVEGDFYPELSTIRLMRIEPEPISI